MERFLSTSVIPLILLALGVGCSATVGADPTPTAAGAQRLAVVDVRVQQSSVEPTLRFDASARFVSVREPGAPADALDILGLAWAPVPAGTCVATGAPPTTDRRAAVRVDLRDLSPVSMELHADDGTTAALQLEARAFPDVMGLVSGVVFVVPSDAAAALTIPPRTATMRVGGGSAFDFDLPELPSKLELVGASALDGTYWVDARGFTVHAAPARPDDRVVVDVLRAGVMQARCALDARGSVTIDGPVLSGPGDSALIVRAQRRAVRDDSALGPVDARLERDLEIKLLVR